MKEQGEHNILEESSENITQEFAKPFVCSEDLEARHLKTDYGNIVFMKKLMLARLNQMYLAGENALQNNVKADLAKSIFDKLDLIDPNVWITNSNSYVNISNRDHAFIMKSLAIMRMSAPAKSNAIITIELYRAAISSDFEKTFIINHQDLSVKRNQKDRVIGEA